MGNWSCFRPRAVTVTAKLIHWDGELEEFCFPVRVSNLRLPENENPGEVFICDADEMGLGEFVSAVEDLVPGKLYFELPVSWVSRRLRAEAMAALAVKASTALAASGGGGGESLFRWCCFIRGAGRKVEPLVMLDDDDEMRRFGGGSTAVSAVVEGGGRRVVGNAVACKKGKFTPQMSMIIEE
ncbi:PREDICTED: uncharacterized protein LOC109164574 [Ipomoea nil]|uniref:uncharacterized protein LOC109164574 n=1 Tax=Ipomoea nil TaxID=35883 RepID=UPI000901AC58|nr:PREDICTED: uncharacterized protein LOC109164574 [Ipomoea nil]